MILGQIISILDVTTDIMVCVGFYQKDRMIFFGISLSILLLALIAYDIAFVGKYSREKPAGDFALFCCLLPISPFIPFILYFTDTNQRPLSIFLMNNCCFTLGFEAEYIPPDASKLRKFMEEKIEKHMGFIIEALVEAFPQAILQMVAIVIYNEANIISIISILLSMLSMASKSFVFSIGLASNIKQLFFNWLCAITDFFSIFVAVSWVFYKPLNDESLINAFDLFQTIWLYKLYICVFPFIGVVSIGMHISGMYEIVEPIWRKSGHSYFAVICGGFCAFIVVTFLWICGCIASVLAFEILHWTFLAFALWALGTDRFTNEKSALQFWYTLIGWINSAKTHRVGTRYKGCVSFTKQQDKIMRICVVNHTLLKREYFPKDRQLKQYLEKNEHENQYMNVTMSGLRSHTKNKWKSEFFRKFWYRLYGLLLREIYDEYKHARTDKDRLRWGFLAFGIGLVTFIFGPIYLFSRIITLFFPGFIILYLLFEYNVNIWNTNSIDMFQIVMITIYLILCIILSILFVLNCSEQYIMSHILPAEDYIYCIYKHTPTQKIIKQITNKYYGIIVIPIRRAIIVDHFGPDLGPIILSYLPLEDEYSNANNDVVKAKMVV